MITGAGPVLVEPAVAAASSVSAGPILVFIAIVLVGELTKGMN